PPCEPLQATAIFFAPANRHGDEPPPGDRADDDARGQPRAHESFPIMMLNIKKRWQNEVIRIEPPISMLTNDLRQHARPAMVLTRAVTGPNNEWGLQGRSDDRSGETSPTLGRGSRGAASSAVAITGSPTFLRRRSRRAPGCP